MRSIDLGYSPSKKQRGHRRKLKALLANIDEFIPFGETQGTYECFHVPCGLFIESPKTSGKVKTAFCRKWLQTTEAFITQKPAELPFCRIVAVLDIPHLWQSQIIIFYDADYYYAFWNRSGPEQWWKPLDPRCSFVKERHIDTSLNERGYHQIIDDMDGHSENNLWFYGELSF